MLFLCVTGSQALAWQPQKYPICWISLSSFSLQHKCKKLMKKKICQWFSKLQKCEVILLFEWPIFCLAFKDSVGTKVNSRFPFILRYVYIFPHQHSPKTLPPFGYFNMKTMLLHFWIQLLHVHEILHETK